MSYIRLFLAAAASVTVTLAANPSIGLAVANGSFQVDKSSVYGNATLFDGSLIETVAVSSDLVLHNGARLRLGSESQARIHADRLVLEKGQTEISATSKYSIEALGLHIAPESSQSRLAVTYSGSAHVQVAALAGSARVSGLNGVLIAAVPAGTALDLDPQAAGAAAPSTLTGTLQLRNGVFLLADEVSHVIYTLAGSGLDSYTGKRVEITGSIDTAARAAAGSSQVIRVLTISEVGKAAKSGGRFWTSPKVIVAGVAIVAVGATAGVVATRGQARSTISAQ